MNPAFQFLNFLCFKDLLLYLSKSAIHPYGHTQGLVITQNCSPSEILQ